MFLSTVDLPVDIRVGDCLDLLRQMPEQSVNTCVTSPPYFGLRDYGHEGQIGLEATPDAFVAKLVEIFREVRRVLRDDGTLWLNLGDSYAGGGGHSPNAPSSATSKSGRYGDALKQGGIKPQGAIKPKDLIGIPWRVAFALQADGWWLRQDIIWSKPNPMPESVTDRCTKAHEYIFLLSKGRRYYFDSAAIKEEAVGKNLHDLTGPGYKAPGQSANTGNRKALRPDVESCHRSSILGSQSMQAEPNGKRNRRSVWTVTTRPFKGAHFATFPPDLIEPCVLAGSPVGGVVLDPFGGAGTTGLVSARNGRKSILCELSRSYAEIAHKRLYGSDQFICPAELSEIEELV